MASTLDKLKKFFNIGIKKDNRTETIVPVEVDINKSTGQKTLKPVQFPSDLQKFYDYYISQCLGNPNDLNQRISRYKDIDYMRFVEPIISFAIDLYANEVSQADVQENVFGFESSNKKFTEYLYNLVYEKWGITQNVVKEWADNLVAYGDCFLINNIDDKEGIKEFTLIDPYIVKERIEFNASKVQYDYYGVNYNTYLSSLTGKDSRLDDLVKNLKANNDINKFFKPYLLGYIVQPDFMLPPWAMTHFRLFTSKSEFYPFGRSLFINAISPYRQLQASKNLMVMARASKIPKEHFEIKTSETMSETEKWEAINEARQEFLNLSKNYNDKEQMGLGTQIWTPEGLLKYSLIENNIKLDDIADIQLMEESLMRSTGVPFDYITMRQGGYTSGIALTKQTKPFARRIYSIQTAILREMVQNIKIHTMITKEFENEDFDIFMNFPNVEDSKDRIDMKNASMELAKSVVETLKNTLGLEEDEALPREIIIDIFSKYGFIDKADLDSWSKSIVIKPPKADTESPDNKQTNEVKLTERLKNKIKEIDSELVGKIYFECKKKVKFFEGIKGENKHFYNSNNLTKEQKDILELFKKPYNQNQVLNENESKYMWKLKEEFDKEG